MMRAAAERFGADRATRLAAALSYYTLFALIPLLFIATAVAGFLFGDPSVVEEVVSQVEELAGEAVAGAVADLVGVAQATAGASLAVGLGLALFTGSTVFLQVQGVLNLVFRAPERLDRGVVAVVRKRVVGAVSAIVLGVLVLVPIASVSAIRWLRTLVPVELPFLAGVLNVAVPLGSLVLLVVVVGFTFKALTAASIPWQAAWRGGGFTAVVGLVAASLVGTYLSRFASRGTLGALGGVAVLLFFGYLMWQVYLFGAELTKVYADYLGTGEVRASEVEVLDGEQPAARGEPMPASRALVVGLLIGLLGRRR